MKDRTPTYPGRVQLVPVAGQTNIYDMTMADEPTEEGDAPVKAKLLSDAVSQGLFNDTANHTVSEALAAASSKTIVNVVGSAEAKTTLASLSVARSELAAATD